MVDRTGKRRLLKLADLLEADAKNKKGIKFDLNDWVADKEGNTRSFHNVETIPINCNTKACAVGLACLSGAFKRSGLGYRIRMTGSLVPTFDGNDNWDAVESFFGLEEQEAFFLFRAGEYPPAKSKGALGERFVAKRIRDFVAGKVAPKEDY